MMHDIQYRTGYVIRCTIHTYDANTFGLHAGIKWLSSEKFNISKKLLELLMSHDVTVHIPQ